MVKEKVNVCVREMLIENKNEDTKKGKKGLWLYTDTKGKHVTAKSKEPNSFEVRGKGRGLGKKKQKSIGEEEEGITGLCSLNHLLHNLMQLFFFNNGPAARAFGLLFDFLAKGIEIKAIEIRMLAQMVPYFAARDKFRARQSNWMRRMIKTFLDALCKHLVVLQLVDCHLAFHFRR